MNDEAFDALLRRTTSESPLPDDGFTARVMAALPPAGQPAPRRSWRGWLVGVAVTAGALVTVFRHPVFDLQSAFGTAIGDALGTAGTAVADVARTLDFGLAETSAALAVIVAATALTYVFVSNRRSDGTEGAEG